MEEFIANNGRMIDMLVNNTRMAMAQLSPHVAQNVWARFSEVVQSVIPEPTVPAISGNTIVPANEGEQGMSKFYENEYGLAQAEGGRRRRRRQTRRRRSQK